MRKCLGIWLVFSLLFVYSCKRDDGHDFGLDCKKLREGIYQAIYETQSNDSLLKVEFKKLTKDLTPKPTLADQYGQLSNLYTLFNRLQVFQDISFYICCYSCIQTAPPQTEVSVCIDSAGYQICRVFDFYTWEHSNLTFAGAHSRTDICR
jgi:hypothetical protein